MAICFNCGEPHEDAFSLRAGRYNYCSTDCYLEHQQTLAAEADRELEQAMRAWDKRVAEKFGGDADLASAANEVSSYIVGKIEAYQGPDADELTHLTKLNRRILRDIVNVRPVRFTKKMRSAAASWRKVIREALGMRRTKKRLPHRTKVALIIGKVGKA